MIEVPPIQGEISLLEAVMAGAIVLAGYVLHETLHVLPLWWWGEEYEIAILPTDGGRSRLWQALFGAAVCIRIDDITHRRLVVAALAPLAMLPLPLGILMVMFTYPIIDSGTLLIVFGWFAVSIPSPPDWAAALSIQSDHDAVMEVTHGQ